MILHWHNPANGRRYQAVLGQDLLGDSFLWRGWCGADGKRGGERKDVFTWEGDGLSALHRVSRRRRKRGYVLVPPLGCVQGANAAGTQVAGIEQASKPLGQVPAS